MHNPTKMNKIIAYTKRLMGKMGSRVLDFNQDTTICYLSILLLFNSYT